MYVCMWYVSCLGINYFAQTYVHVHQCMLRNVMMTKSRRLRWPTPTAGFLRVSVTQHMLHVHNCMRKTLVLHEAFCCVDVSLVIWLPAHGIIICYAIHTRSISM